MDVLNEMACLLARASTSNPSDSSSSAVRIPLLHFKQEEKLKLPGLGKLLSKAFLFSCGVQCFWICALLSSTVQNENV